MDYGLLFWLEAAAYSQNTIMDGFVAFQFTRCSLMDWSCVDYCDIFISSLDSHSDGTHSLQMIHW